jgi:hypothetical protein
MGDHAPRERQRDPDEPVVGERHAVRRPFAEGHERRLLAQVPRLGIDVVGEHGGPQRVRHVEARSVRRERHAVDERDAVRNLARRAVGVDQVDTTGDPLRIGVVVDRDLADRADVDPAARVRREVVEAVAPHRRVLVEQHHRGRVAVALVRDVAAADDEAAVGVQRDPADALAVVDERAQGTVVGQAVDAAAPRVGEDKAERWVVARPLEQPFAGGEPADHPARQLRPHPNRDGRPGAARPPGRAGPRL